MLIAPDARDLADPQLAELTGQIHDALIEHLGTTRKHCRHASYLLMHLAHRLGVRTQMMVGGICHDHRPDGEGHFWVQAGPVIYDPTVDQFPGRLNDPLVRLASDVAYIVEPVPVGHRTHPDALPAAESVERIAHLLEIQRDWHAFDAQGMSAYAAQFGVPLAAPKPSGA